METIKLQFFIVVSLILMVSFNTETLRAQEHVYTKSFSKTINIKNKAIVIDAEKANINIEETAGDNLIVDIRFISKHGDKKIAAQQLEYLNQVINVKFSEVYIRNYILINANEDLSGSIHTLYTLKIPKNKTIQISNSLGDISISNIAGNFTIKSKYGKVNIDNITGDLSLDAQVGDVMVKNSQLNCNLEAKYLSAYFYNCGGNYNLVTNLGSLNFMLNKNLSTLAIDASGTEINLLNRDCLAYNLTLASQNGGVLLDKCSIANKAFIKLDSRNTTNDKKEFIYFNPLIKPSISVKNKFANISLQ